MSKRKIFLLSAVLVLAAAAIGVTVAFMFKKTEVNNSFEAGKVSCEVYELFDDAEYSDGIHNGNRKNSIKVKNTGNTDAYIRIKLVSYWVDFDGNVVGIPSKPLNLELKNGWFEGESQTYYYNKAISPESFTEILCSPIILETNQDINGKTVYQKVDVFAEAIQSSPKKAAELSWNITVDENGILKNN